MSNETPIIVTLIKDAIECALIDLNTAIPAKVVAFDAKKQTVDVQPSLKASFADGQITSLPRLDGVPVQYPRSKKGGVRFPLSVGDGVLLVFAQRSLDVWKSKGGEVDPQEARKFNMSDAIAIPGVFSPAEADGDFPSSGLELKWNGAKITLADSGKLKIESGADELIDLLSQVVDAITQLTVMSASPGNPTSVPINIAVFQALKLKLDAMKG